MRQRPYTYFWVGAEEWEVGRYDRVTGVWVVHSIVQTSDRASRLVAELNDREHNLTATKR